MKYAPIKNFINGRFVSPGTSGTMDVISPVDGTLLSQVPMSSSADLDIAASGTDLGASA